LKGKHMKTFTTLMGLLLLSVAVAFSEPTNLILKSPKAGDSYRIGRTVTLSWDTTLTYNTAFEFFWGTSQNGPWTLLTLPKGATSFKDSTSGNKAVGTTKTVMPSISTPTLYIKMRIKNNDNLTSIVGPITVTMPQPSVVDSTLQGDITGSITLTSQKIYGLKGVVFVQNGGVLNIEPGTKILGEVGATSAICVNRGGKIYAKGTAQNPIVMTSGARPGERDRGDWGGLLIMGKATTNLVEAPIEGGIADDDTKKVNGWYGGNDDNDNSGELSYLRIEFAGIAESPDNELNSLTLGAVGAGTKIDHIQVSYCGDDGYEWFGGTVNLKNIISWNTIDDDLDSDNGYRGKIQYGLVRRFNDVADQSNSEAFESDNDSKASEKTPFTAPVFSNITVIGPVHDTSWASWAPGLTYDNTWNPKYLTAAQIRRNSRMSLFNSVIIGWPRGIEMTNQNTVRAADQDSIMIRSCSFYGIKYQDKYFYFGSGTSAQASVDLNWLAKTEYHNEIHNGMGKVDDLAMINDAFGSEIDFDPTPIENAPYLNNAKFDYSGIIPINNSFFDKVTYRGAFPSTGIIPRWDLPWAEYDPVNKEYKTVSVEDDFNDNKIVDVIVSPQPATDYAKVRYYLPEYNNVTIKFFDAVGSLVSTFAESLGQSEGYYEFKINTSGLQSGIYFVQISIQNGTITNKVIVIR
jgi:hypothetical protein